MDTDVRRAEDDRSEKAIMHLEQNAIKHTTRRSWG